MKKNLSIQTKLGVDKQEEDNSQDQSFEGEPTVKNQAKPVITLEEKAEEQTFVVLPSRARA